MRKYKVLVIAPPNDYKFVVEADDFGTTPEGYYWFSKHGRTFARYPICATIIEDWVDPEKEPRNEPEIKLN